MLTYSAKLIGDPQDLADLRELLVQQRNIFNFASSVQFGEKNSIVLLHSKVYKNARKTFPNVNSQVIIKAEQDCLAAYRSIKANKHKISEPVTKSNLSLRLDVRLCSKRTSEGIRITTVSGPKNFRFQLYPKLADLLKRYKYADPLVYENGGSLYIALPFDNKEEKRKQKLALGVDIGMRRAAATSDGRIIIDRKFNGEKRRLIHLKDELKSKGTKSARRHLRKLRRKERNKNKNQTHHVANKILQTEADTIVLENLKGIKRKKTRYQNKRAIGQVPMAELRRILTYKAENSGKTVLLVCPAYTSQRDSFTGKVEGERRGCRFFAKSGIVYDADVNAAVNIAKLSKLPVSYGNILDGQAHVTAPHAHQSFERVPCRPPNLFGGK